jgi:5-dehydro-2-deoxygluconokinase
VHEWLQTAASVSGFIGFAVGRTAFWEPVVGWRDKKTTREAAKPTSGIRHNEKS